MSLQQEDLVPANPQVLSVSLLSSDLFFSLLPFPPSPSMIHLSLSLSLFSFIFSLPFPSSPKDGMVQWKDHGLWSQADLGLTLTSSTF